jgi:hypothetical protein
MKLHLLNLSWVAKGGMLLAALAALIGLLRPTAAKAHCDSVEGPVVAAARAALAAQDVTLILPYVPASAESELTAAFKHTLEVRALGPEAKALADRYFFETAVRLHRAGEGAAYTGLVEGAIEDPALLAADAALAGGDLDQVYGVLEEAVHGGLVARFAAVHETREHAAATQTVAAERERVEAELGFEKYVYAIYTAAAGAGAHASGETAATPVAAHHH